MKKSESHLKTEERIDQYVSGKLSQEQIDEVWADVLTDTHAYEYLKTTVSLRNIVRSRAVSGVKPAQKSVKKAIPLSSYAIAAGFALALGTTSVFLYLQQSPSIIQPLQTLEYTTLRSSTEMSPDNVQSSIQTAINLALQGQAEQSELILRDIYEGHEDAVIRSSALMNLGIVQYNAANYPASIASFVLFLSQFDEDLIDIERAQWNLAQSYLANNQIGEARVVLEQVVKSDGAHSRVARTYLDRLR